MTENSDVETGAETARRGTQQGRAAAADRRVAEAAGAQARPFGQISFPGVVRARAGTVK